MTLLPTTRRSFFRNLAIAAGGLIVAPSIAEVLAVNAKKYFFLRDNPLAVPPNLAYLLSLLRNDPSLAPRILHDPASIRRAGQLLGYSDEGWVEKLRQSKRPDITAIQWGYRLPKIETWKVPKSILLGGK